MASQKKGLLVTKVIAFSLWGDWEKYTIGAIRNAEIASNIYPDWVCRYYVGRDVPEDILNQLQAMPNTQICPMLAESNWNGMFWRFFAADSDDVMVSRDVDSRLSLREKAAVDEWLDGDKDFHIMRDHPYHATEIMGGMWGVRNGLLRGITDMITNYDKGELDNKHQVDQTFLKDKIWPLVKDKAHINDEWFAKIPFPPSAPAWTELNFVGNAFNEYDKVITDEEFIREKKRRNI